MGSVVLAESTADHRRTALNLRRPRPSVKFIDENGGGPGVRLREAKDAVAGPVLQPRKPILYLCDPAFALGAR